jgi:hypothetical protein
MSTFRDVGTRAGVSAVLALRTVKDPQANGVMLVPSRSTGASFRPPRAHSTPFVTFDSSSHKIVFDPTARS